MERAQSVNQLIKKELSQILLREIDFSKDTLVTITRVETSSNLIHSKVYINVIPENQNLNIIKILKREIYHLQQKINKRLKMRPIPKIEFIEEKEIEKAGRVEELLEKIKDEKK